MWLGSQSAARAVVALVAVLATFCTASEAEERPSPQLTALSSTTITGYVNVAAYWDPTLPWESEFGVRFYRVCNLLRARGFRQITIGNVYLFERPGTHIRLTLRRVAQFATPQQIRELRAFLLRQHLQ